ncbi:MAG: RidA family protein [Thermoplasmata archaeon]|nr:MAG: RidA family protein [Thermoplasmata archaeon]
MVKRTIHSTQVSETKAPYTQGVVYDSLLFVSGQVAFDSEAGSVTAGDIEAQAAMALRNLKAVIEEAGSRMDKVLKVTVFLTDINDFARFNDIYREFFSGELPARSCVEVSNLPFGARVEIEAIAHL